MRGFRGRAIALAELDGRAGRQDGRAASSRAAIRHTRFRRFSAERRDFGERWRIRHLPRVDWQHIFQIEILLRAGFSEESENAREADEEGTGGDQKNAHAG
jgi:hypothetical protein